MTTTHALNADEVYVLARDEGRHMHFLNNLATIKASPGATGSMSAVEFSAPRGFGPPLHSHRDEDEITVVLEGEVAFRSELAESTATAGAFVYLPRGVSHTFQVMSESARMLSITASPAGPPQFDQMVAALGEPTEVVEIPRPSDIDPGHVAQVTAQHGVDVLGPPPAPLD